MEKNEIIITHGEDARRMAQEVLEAAHLAQHIRQGASIGIKPNLVLDKPCSSGATTSPELVAGLIEYLKAHGHNNLLILEGAWIGGNTKKAFRVCGYEDLSKRYGVPLFDTKDDSYSMKTYGGIEMEVSDRALAVDFLINMPVLKGHCQTKVTGALKNMKGCISDREKRRFHSLGLHKPIAYLNTQIKSSFVLVDGICGDLDFEEGGNPVRMNRVFCAKDPVLADAYIASFMGYAPEEIAYITIAEQCGIGSADLSNARVVTLRRDDTKAQPASSRKVQRLAQYTDERQACSSCYANLIHALARLDEERAPASLRKVCIGQGFRGVKEDAVGVGKCTAGLSRSLPGCPPTAAQIKTFLKEVTSRE